MPDLAELGFKTDTSDLKKASGELKKVGTESKKTEDNVVQLGKGFKGLGNQSGIAAKAVGGFSSSLRGLAGVVTGIVSTALAGIGLQKFIAGTVEADRQQAQLAAAIASTGGVAGQTIKTLNAHASALQLITNYGDEATNAMQSVLLTFTNIRSVFPKATEAVIDMSARLGTDLQSSALQVGKALNDPVAGVSALGRAGVQFSASQKKVIKDLVATGDLVGAQTILLKELENQFGGSAKAARATLGGALTSLGNSFGDLFELGKSATEGLRLAIEDLIVAINDPGFVTFVKTIGGILVSAFSVLIQVATLAARGLSVIGDNLDYLKVAAIGLTPILLSLFGPVILSGIVSFIGLIKGAVTAVKLLTIAIAANPLGLLAVALSTIIGYLIVFRDKINPIKGELATIGDYATATFELIGVILDNIPDTFRSASQKAANYWLESIEYLIRETLAGVNGMIASVNGILRDAGSSFQLPFGPTPGKINLGRIDIGGDQAGANLESAYGASSIRERANQLAQLRIEAEATADTFNNLDNAASGVADAIGEIGEGKSGKKAKDELKSLREEAAGFFSDLSQGFIQDVIGSIKNGENAIQAFGDAALNVLDKITNKLLDIAFDQLFDNIFKNAGQGDGGGSIFSLVSSLLFNELGNVFENGRVKKFATGGVVGSATAFPMASGVGVMGEAGPEAIMPLRRGRGGRLGVDGGNGGSNVHIEIIDQRGANAAPIRQEGGTRSDGSEFRRFIITAVQEATVNGQLDDVNQKRFNNRPQKVYR